MTNDLFKDIIPAQAMGITVRSFEYGRMELTAPLSKNLNDKGTGFAGSIASMLSLAGWGAITASLHEAGVSADVMIVKSEIEYSAAVRFDLVAEADVPVDEVERILQDLAGRGRSRVCISATLHSNGSPCAVMTAHYAVIK